MGLSQLNFEGKDKEEVAMDIISAFTPHDQPYYLADSGGKDSEAMRHLTMRTRAPFDAHYCVSPIDPPQIHTHLKTHHPDTQWDYHARNFWGLVTKNGLPRRQARWCCRYIKEAGGHGRVVLVGNRRAEGRGGRRRHQNCFEQYKDKIYVRPIIDWSEAEVWEYIKKYDIPYCQLYDEGFRRLGCVLCPFERNIKRELEYFPKIARLWRRSCDRIVERRLAKGKDDFISGQELWDWWIERD